LPRNKETQEKIVERTGKTYSGPLEIGEDLMVFEIRKTIRVTRASDRSQARPEIVPEL
jgi:hypothetical protein